MENNMPTGAKSIRGLGVLEPMKKWEEKTADERIETLRQEIMNGRYTIRRMYKLESDMRQMNRHTHGTDGRPTLSIDDFNRDDYDSMPSMIDPLA